MEIPEILSSSQRILWISPGGPFQSYYNTPFGSLLIGIDAKSVDIAETEDDIDVKVKYNLEVNYEHLADCSIRMHIKSKEARDFTLS